MLKTQEKKINLVITDRYCIANHKTAQNKECEVAIREISLDTARHYIGLSDIYQTIFQINSEYIKNVYSNLIEGISENNQPGIFKIDEETSFLLIALNEHTQLKFYIIMDNSTWPTHRQ